jgi:CRISPR-associated protein Cas5t
MKVVHARLRGFTASFRHPLVITGTQLSTPLPSFSTILGVLGACVGKTVTPRDTRIGFDFRCSGTGSELERTNRLEYTAHKLQPHHKGQGLTIRQVLLYPQLDLYVTNVSFLEPLKYPVSLPKFGRSQDLAWVEFAKEADLERRARGRIGPTLLPESFSAPGLILRLPEWMDNKILGVPRLSGPFTRFKALFPYGSTCQDVEGPELYHPSDGEPDDYVIHLHEWTLQR